MAQKKEECFLIVAASLFLAGAVFMLVNTFGTQEWALWVGLACAVCAVLVYAIVKFARMRFDKKYTARESEIIAKQQKNAETAPVIALESVPVQASANTSATEKKVATGQVKQQAKSGSTKSKKTTSKKPVSKKKK